MFVVVKKSKTSKRELVYIVESYRDEKKRIRQRIIKKCGELSELLEEDPNALEKLKEEAKDMTSNVSTREVDMSINLSLPNSLSSQTVNYGYFFVESLYHSLGMTAFLERHFDDPAEGKQVREALRFYAIKEFFLPLTGENGPEDIKPIFGFKGNSKNLALDTLTKLFPFADDLMKHLYKVSCNSEMCKDKVASLDITSYYFNSAGANTKVTRTDEEAMSDLIMVQMGLLYDRYRNPMACIVMPEGENNSQNLLEIIDRLKEKFMLDRIVLTSDRGFGSNSLLAALFESGNGYVVGRKVKNSPLKLQNAILDEDGYKWNDAGTFKFKTFNQERVIGEEVISEKVISMWTSHNAAKMKQKRDKFIVDFLSNPHNYSKGEFPDMDKYVSMRDLSETDEEDSEQNFFSFDSESYARDMALDGYYALATTELEIPESVIIRRYHNLQKMHKAFSEPDSDIEGTPQEIWTRDYVRAYFIISFIALVMENKLVRMLGFKRSAKEIKAALRTAMCKNIGQEIYVIAQQPDAYKEIEKAFGVKFDRAYATLEMVRKYRKEIIKAIDKS